MSNGNKKHNFCRDNCYEHFCKVSAPSSLWLLSICDDFFFFFFKFNGFLLLHRPHSARFCFLDENSGDYIHGFINCLSPQCGPYSRDFLDEKSKYPPFSGDGGGMITIN